MSISFSGIILDEKSKKYLRSLYLDKIPSGWKWYGQHMTICMGELPPNLKKDLSKKITLNVEYIGENKFAIALLVSGYYTKNNIPHITLAVNDEKGGSPKDSKNITNWSYIEPFQLTGTIEEVPNQKIEEYERKGQGIITNGNPMSKDDLNYQRQMDLPPTQHSSMNVREHKTKEEFISEVISTFPKNVGGMGASLEGWVDSGVDKDGVGLDYILEENQSNDSKEKILNAMNNILPFKNDIMENGGEMYAVGGIVRDMFINKPSDDLDIVVRGIPHENLETILKKYGHYKLTGTNFGVYKFKANDENINNELESLGLQTTIDIALPRIDTKGEGKGHQGIEAQADYKLSIVNDLKRRDFTINSIAMDTKGNIIDPFGGVDDMKSGIIKWTNPEAFLDDPLRILRAIRFASVFGYELDTKTFNAVEKTSKRLLELPRERFRMEFIKMLNKENPGKIITHAINLIKNLNIYDIIFGVPQYNVDFSKIKNMSEFGFLIYGNKNNATEKFEKYFLATNDEIEDLIGFQMAQSNVSDDFHKRLLVFNIIKITNRIFDSSYFPGDLRKTYEFMKNNNIPLKTKELTINGNDLMNLGFKGKEIGEKIREILRSIFNDDLKNNHEDILNFLIKDTEENLNENIENGITSISAYDMDGTLLNTPLENEGREEWEKRTKEKFPFIGWWGRSESLDTQIFDIKPFPNILSHYMKDFNDKNNYTLILTNRVQKLDDTIIRVFKENNIPIYDLNTKAGRENKGERLKLIYEKFPNVKIINFYDDDMRHLNDVRETFESKNLTLNLFLVKNDQIQKVN
jgi:tRNA nucleotidyltransferase (CCA-adding enzyme)